MPKMCISVSQSKEEKFELHVLVSIQPFFQRGLGATRETAGTRERPKWELLEAII